MTNIFRLTFHRGVVSLALVSILFACSGGGGGSTSSGGPDVENVVNPGLPPTANAGVGSTYNGGELAMLDGTGSTDPDNDPLRYTWLQTGGTHTVQLSDTHAARPVFEAPNANDVLTFSLTVNDGYDNSVQSSVTITTVLYSGASVTALSRNPFRGSYSISGAGEDFVISGNHLYFPAGVNRLHVFDITDPANLTEVGAAPSPQPQAQDATLIGHYIYHTSYESISDVHIYATDVANPAAPTLYCQAALFTSTSTASITSVGNVLYAVSGNRLYVYQVTDIASPLTTHPTTSISLPAPAEDVEVVGNYAYVADGASGLRIIDISSAVTTTPSISETGSFDTAGSAVNVAVSGNYAYVADGLNGLVILNISNPASPTLVFTIPTPSGTYYGATSVVVSGSTLYYSNDFDVWVYDVSNPASPAALGYYRAGNLIRKVRVAGSYIYVSDSQGLRSIPAAKVSMPRGAALYTASSAVKDMKVYGDLGFVRMDHRVDILDMRNQAAPSFLSSYTAQGFNNLSGMAIVDNFAYLSEGFTKLQLLRFRNPAASDIAKSIDLGANAGAQQIIANDTYAYVYRNAFPNASVQIFDVTNPYSPVAKGSLASPHNDANWLRSMAVRDNRLYLTELNTGGTFWVANVSNPAAPSLYGTGLGSVDLYGLAFRNDYVLSIGNNFGVRSIDVSDPASPAFVGSGYPQYGYSISVAGNRGYTNSGIVGGNVVVLDLEDPLAPKLAGELAPAGGADFPVVAGRSLYSFYNGVELHRSEREPVLATRYITGSTGATLSYSVSWLDEAGGDDHAVKCLVTGGTCTVDAINQTANSATISWILPGSAGDHEIVILVGNAHYFGTTKDRMQVQ